MRMTAGDLVDLYEADPDNYYDELDARLGVTHDERGFKTIKSPLLNRRSLSFLDIGEAFCGKHVLRTLHERPYGMRGGRARTRLAAGEEVGAGALGPSQFQAINAWLGTTAGLLGAELLARYEEAARIAREIVTWELNVRTQDVKLPRYSRPTLPTEDLLPKQEFPSGNLGAEFVRANRLSKQGESLAVTWEASHFDQTGDLMEAAGQLSDGIGHNVENKVMRGVFGIENTYEYNGTRTDTYRTTGSYVNKITNQLVDEDSIDVAEQQLLAQTDPGTGRPMMFRGPRNIITSQALALTAQRISRMTSVEVGALSDASRFITSPTITGLNPYISQFIQPLLTTSDVRFSYTAITLAQAKQRWVYGDTKGAFKYRSAKDLTTYQFTITDDPALARKDVLMEMDVSEMGSLSVIETRRAILNIKDS